jgi:hypothetical protein
MEVANRPASGTEETYGEWLLVQKASVCSYYTNLHKVSETHYGRKKGRIDVKSMVSIIENHLNKCVTHTVVELEKLMRSYRENDLIFRMQITSITDKLEGKCMQSYNEIHIPEELKIHVFYLCHILLLERLND